MIAPVPDELSAWMRRTQYGDATSYAEAAERSVAGADQGARPPRRQIATRADGAAVSARRPDERPDECPDERPDECPDERLDNVDAVIARLMADLRPVRQLASPRVRAGMFRAVVACRLTAPVLDCFGRH